MNLKDGFEEKIVYEKTKKKFEKTERDIEKSLSLKQI